jgi:hypothetical protein
MQDFRVETKDYVPLWAMETSASGSAETAHEPSPNTRMLLSHG